MMFGTQENNEITDRDTNRFGRFGEERAANYLRQRGYTIVLKNFRTAIGRSRKGVALVGEIDLIAIKAGKICFVEVKSRTKEGASPERAVTRKKQRLITRTAAAYIRLFEIESLKPRFDVISILENTNRAPDIKHFKRFWDSGKFK